MKDTRQGCSDVMVDQCIIVIGGTGDDVTDLNSVEMFSFDTYSWKDLPPMQKARSGAVGETF